MQSGDGVIKVYKYGGFVEIFLRGVMARRCSGSCLHETQNCAIRWFVKTRTMAREHADDTDLTDLR